MDKVILKDQNDLDKANISFSDFQQANDDHIQNVKRAMSFVAKKIKENAENHDWTKKAFEDLYFHDVKAARKEGKDYKDMKWFQNHKEIERHHLDYSVPDDVNIFDLIETLVDCVVDGLTEDYGDIKIPKISDDVFNDILSNTVDALRIAMEVR